MSHQAKKSEPASEGARKELFSSSQLSQQTRVALFVVSLLNFSMEAEEVTEGAKSLQESQSIEHPVTDVDGRYSWNAEMMLKLSEEFCVPEQFVDMYSHLLPTQFNRKKMDLHDAYLAVLADTSYPSDCLPPASLCSIVTVLKLAIFLIANGCYNAKGRAFIQNMCAVMSIPTAEYVMMERNISRGLSHIQASLSRLQEEGKGKKSHDYKRYAKIGAVSVGAGALLAITGGLAAPAVAAALLVFGTSTAVAAAAMTSATVMSGLFGSAGMSLAGYKMARRTRGITEFVFESEESFGSKLLKNKEEAQSEDDGKEEDEESGNWTSHFHRKKKEDKHSSEAKEEPCRINHLSVMICVSGWMIDGEDYKKAFGIVPHEMQDEERLRRFYQIHCPQKVERAADDIRAWKNTGGTSGSAEKEKEGHKEGEYSTFDTLRNSVSSSIGNIGSTVGMGNDIDEFYQNLTEIYGSDPRTVESLVPPPRFPSQFSSGDLPGQEAEHSTSDSDMMSHILESITIAFDNKKRADDRLAEMAKEGRNHLPDVKLRTRTPTSSPVKLQRKHFKSEDEERESEAAADSDEDSELKQGVAGLKTESLASGAAGQDKVKEGEGGGDEEEAKALVVNSNDTQARLESDFWHWNQTDLSGVYELNLLRWETPMQLELGKCIQQMLKDLTEAVTTKVLQATIFAALMTAVIVPYSLIKFMDKIDNIWDIATERADAAGKMLAHVLLKRPQGSRSVTLVGHSIGARLIFSCLQELYRCKQVYLEARLEAWREEAADRARRAGKLVEKKKQSFTSSMMSGMKSMFDDKDTKDKHRLHKDEDKDKDREGKEEKKDDSAADLGLDLIDRRLARRDADVEDFSLLDFKQADNIVQDVVLLGTPSSTSRSEWSKARAVVTGRFINGYSRNDIILALVYRYNKLTIKVAGLREIHVNGMENIDFSDTVKKHTDYCLNMQQILSSINLLGAADPANVFLFSDDSDEEVRELARDDVKTDSCPDEETTTA